MVYIRKADENLLANKVLVEVFKRKKERKPTLVRYDREEKLLLDHLRNFNQITFSQFCRLATIPPRIAERILVNLVSIGVLEIHMNAQPNYFTLAKMHSKAS
jgi:hypothetical protein